MAVRDPSQWSTDEFEQGALKMKTGICSAIAAAAFIALAGHASADEPAQLSDAQMDGVTGSGIAIAQAIAATASDLLSETRAESESFVNDSVLATGTAASTAMAASVFFPAVAASESTAAAALP
jgi:hypothetical protein